MPEALIKYFSWLFFIAALLPACNKKMSSGNQVIAQVGNKYLYTSDVDEVIPSDLSVEDSITMAEDYITKWVKTQLMVQKAESNLTVDQKNLSRELEEYRNSLIIYRYKNELLRQRMDTTVNETQIVDYYESNTENFKLNKAIVKAIYVQIPEEFAEPEQLKEWSNNPTDENIIELRDYCVQFAKNYNIITNHWVDFEVINRNIPQQIEDAERFLTQNTFFETTESDYYYLLFINDYKLKGELAPIEYVQDNIKNLILNRRKIEFLKEVENNVYTEGVRQNKFKILKRETNETE